MYDKSFTPPAVLEIGVQQKMMSFLTGLARVSFGCGHTHYDYHVDHRMSTEKQIVSLEMPLIPLENHQIS